ncbi:MAG TPA: ankyrin repeat domain-containing protein, partial [Dehalococcoidia bacterium]|nr:ankyrin repeat domain-containing protein [Dehalococcoidia bacterium]
MARTRTHRRKAAKSKKSKRKTRSKRQRGGAPIDELITATKQGNIDMIKKAFNDGANVNGRDITGMTAIMWASINGHTDVVTMLLKRGSYVNTADNSGMTALIWAAAGKGHIDIVTKL